MSAFTLQRRPKGHRNWKACENGCRTARGELAGSSHVAWLLDTPIYLCSTCATAWSECWDRAHGGIEQEAQAAA